jgi:hypothetical protein
VRGDTHRSAEGEDATPPVAQDDFAEFAEPPRHRPPAEALQERPSEPEADSAQSEVDDVIARLRRERAEEG